MAKPRALKITFGNRNDVKVHHPTDKGFQTRQTTLEILANGRSIGMMQKRNFYRNNKLIGGHSGYGAELFDSRKGIGTVNSLSKAQADVKRWLRKDKDAQDHIRRDIAAQERGMRRG